MPDKILVALDGSEGSQRAVDFAVKHASATQAEIILAYVIDWSPYSFNTPEENEARYARRESEIQKANDTVLMPVADKLAADGFTVSTIVRHGKIARVLADLSKENGVSQVFIGKLGESRARTAFFGSVTVALVQESPVPVVIVP